MRYILLNLPNPPNKNIHRGYAGGFGTLGNISRKSLLPIYILYAASAMEKVRCKYKVLDAQSLKYSASQVFDFVKKEDADILISWVSIVSLNDDLKLLNNIKKENPRMKIVVLGAISNVLPEKVFSGGIDLIIRGTYPYYNLISNMVHIFNNDSFNKENYDMINGAVYIKNGKILYSSLKPLKENLDELSIKVYNLLPVDNYVDYWEDINGKRIKCIPIVTGVGCPFSCMYCPYPIGYGKDIINKSIDNIIKEIEFLKNNFGISGFIFRDQLFTHDIERVTKLCDKIIKKDLKIKWLVEARADKITKELVLKMKDAGCFRIHYGVETGDLDILKKTGKPGLSMDKIKKSFQITKDAKILAQAQYIVGLPEETNLTLKNSLKFLYLLNPDNVNIGMITPYPGTKLYELAKEKNWIVDFNLENYTGFSAVMRTDELDIKKLNFARKEMIFKFNLFKLKKDRNYRKLFIKNVLRFLYREVHRKVNMFINTNKYRNYLK